MRRWVAALVLLTMLTAATRAQEAWYREEGPVGCDSLSAVGDDSNRALNDSSATALSEAALATIGCDTTSGVGADSNCAHADSILPWPQNIQMRLDALLTSDIFTTSSVGMEVYDLTADSVIYAYNERQLLRPASTMKMITAVTALDRLGGDCRFKTELFCTGSVEDSVLHGDLYCRGGMDPLFNNDDMGALVESLRSLGIDSIDGYVYADVSMKDTLPMGEGWCWDDDNPPLTPLLLGGKDRFMPRFIDELQTKLQLRGAEYAGSAVTPTEATLLCRRFHTIDQVLTRMMKKSDNLFAEAMFYNIATATGRPFASAQEVRYVVGSLITKMGLQPRDYYVADGSGLSLYNYVSAHLEVEFLKYAYVNRNIYIHLLPALPVAGVDGTLAKRMRGTCAQGVVKAKTGAVTGVSALAGYCTAANGHYLCFAIINQGLRHTSAGRRFQDGVCEALCR